MAWDLPPGCVGFVELQKDGLPAGLAATADELDAKRPRRQEVWAALWHPRTWQAGSLLHFPLHVGPGGLAAESSGAREEAERSAAFGGKLQAAKIADVEPVAGGPDGSYARAAEGLIQGP
jgi:hypothetical protein